MRTLYFCPVVSSLFFPRLISAIADWKSTILAHLHTWCGLSVNFGCRYETCCTRLAANTGRKKKSPKIRHLRTVAQVCWAISSQKGTYRQSEKTVLLNTSISLRCPYNTVNFGPLTAVIGSLVWGTPTAFASWQRYCTAL